MSASLLFFFVDKFESLDNSFDGFFLFFNRRSRFSLRHCSRFLIT